jgi:hypothetical protein
VAKAQIKQKHQGLLNEMFVAKELGMTLTQLREGMTYEELNLWLIYHGVVADEREEAIKKGRNKRR